MKRAAVICMRGFEEVEGISVVDMLRRLDIECHIVGEEKEIRGSHDIRVGADRLLSEISEDEYDAIILPGGMPGAANLRDNDKVISLIKEMDKNGKIVAAICAAPMVLE